MEQFCNKNVSRMKTYFQMKTRHYMIEKYIKKTPLNRAYLYDKPMSKDIYIDLFMKLRPW